MGTGNRLTAYDGMTLAWDDAGFLTSKTDGGTTKTFYWSARGQLDSVVVGSTVTRFEYDGLGRRIKKDHDGTVTQYVYDGDDVFMELDGSGSIVAEYTLYPGTDQLHSMIRGGETYYYATDEKGTVLGLMDDLGLVENKYRYDPWGLPEGTATEGVTNPFRYIGREWDDETGLLLLRARYYDPQIGRFISEDPIGLAGGINPFAYASGDPINRADPSGLDDDCVYVGEATYEWDAFAEEWDLVSISADQVCGGGRGGGGGNATNSGPCRRIRDAALRKRCEESMARLREDGGIGELPACFAAGLEFAGRLVVDVGLAAVYSSGVGLTVRGLLLLAEGQAIKSGVILTATMKSAQTSGAGHLAGGRFAATRGTGTVGGVALGLPPHVSALPGGNLYEFFKNDGFSACDGG